MMGKGVDQSATEVSVTRMHDHACLLVQHEHIIVLINDIQWNVLRKNLQTASLIRHDEGDHITRS